MTVVRHIELRKKMEKVSCDKYSRKYNDTKVNQPKDIDDVS